MRDGIAEIVLRALRDCCDRRTGTPGAGAGCDPARGNGTWVARSRCSRAQASFRMLHSSSRAPAPLVYLVAWQLVCAGAPVRALLLTMPTGPDVARGRHLAGSARDAGRPAQGHRVAACNAAGRGVKVMHVTDLSIEGREQVRSVRFRHRGRERSIQTPLVLLHEGRRFRTPISPSRHSSTTSGTPLSTPFAPRWTSWGSTNERGGAGRRRMARASSAAEARDGVRAHRGARSGPTASGDCACSTATLSPRRHRASLARQRRFREFLDFAFEPAAAVLRPSDPGVTAVPLRGR